jgi:phosphate transport system substrate-binding protein
VCSSDLTNLAPKLAAAYLDSIGDTGITIAVDPDKQEKIVSGTRGPTREAIVVLSHTETYGFQSLLRDEADAAFSTRRITPAEHEELARLGDMNSAASEHIIALDGIAVIMNPNNRTPSLNAEQLRAIFSGTVHDWAEVGGAPGPITVWSSGIDSGTYDAFAQDVLGTAPLAATAHQTNDENAMAAAIAADPTAIGYLSQAHVGTAMPVAIAAVGSDPALPTPLGIQTEDYPFTRRLYLYTASAPQNPFVQRFAEFVQSDKGQAEVEAAGFVSLNVHQATPAVPAGASDQYRKLVDGATQLSMVFRFQPGANGLDNRGQRDMERLVEFLRQSRLPTGRLLLIGFADNTGAPTTNAEIARSRANQIAAMLAQHGIPGVLVQSFGAELPIADNATAEGRDRNRRVEVFIMPDKSG